MDANNKVERAGAHPAARLCRGGPLWTVAVALACAGVIAAYRVLVVFWPSLGDAALFLYFGRRMNEGAQLYVDIWDLKPPIIFLVNALAHRLGGASAAIAVIETIALIAAGLLLARMLRLAGGWPPAIAAGLIFYALFVSYEPAAEGGNYSEFYVLPFAALSMMLFVAALEGRAGSALGFGGAGAAACLAAWAKLPGMAPLLAQLGFLAAMLLVPGRSAAAARALAWCLAGFAACLGAGLGLAALFTDLRLLIDGSLLHPLHYAREPVPGSVHDLAGRSMIAAGLAVPVLFTLGAALAGAAGLARAMRAEPGPRLLVDAVRLQQYCGLFALWTLADLAGALGTGRHYGHYFLPLGASAGAASVLLMSWARLGAPRAARPLLALFAVALCMLAVNAVRTAYWRTQLRPAGFEAAVPDVQKPILAALRVRGSPGDTLAVWGNMHALYLASGLRNAVPHLALINGADSDYAARTKAAGIAAGLRRCPASFILLPAQPPRFSEEARRLYGAIAAGMERSYRPVFVSSDLILYQRTGGQGPGCR